MKKLFLPLILIASGCAVQPQNYDLSTSGSFPPIKTKQNITNLEISTFKYEPHVSISQNTISHLGCLPCQADGSSAGLVFSTPINEIVQAEVKNALDEVIIPSVNPECKLGATIHMAAWDVMDGDTIVDITYTLTKFDQIKYIKRIRGHHDSALFETNKIDRFLAKASRKSAELLVTNNEFFREWQSNCANAQ
ncbi:hypothetical protein [Shewanella baltica]|uniref:hypothetical protein n=1 Tax=Shewanella baltica TaxID=62322 RepID=UPI000E00F49B|nr:hypothetical protein [Shewanella baltica]SUI42942.1 Uncharacterised protein [Shewanella baltica]